MMMMGDPRREWARHLQTLKFKRKSSGFRAGVRAWPLGASAGVMVVGLLLACVSFAAKPTLSPEWASSVSDLIPNQSFLDHWSDGRNESGMGIILDPKTAAEMEIKYHDLTRAHEMRESYGISSPQDDRTYYGRAEEFSRHLFRLILNYQVQRRLEKAEKNSSEVRAISTMQRAAEKLTVEVDENVHFGTKTDIPGQKGRLWMTTPYVNGALDIDFGAPWEDPSEVNLRSLDPSERARDRYRLSLTRELPLWNLKSGVSYGFSSTVMTASLSKDLIAGLSCQLLTRRGLNEGPSGFGEREEAFKVLYKVQF